MLKVVISIAAALCQRMKNWVKEIIVELVRIRKAYTEEMKKGE